MSGDITRTPRFKWGFEIARRLRFKGFRERLHDAGGGTEDVALIPATYDESLKDVLETMNNYRRGLLVVQDDQEPEGVRLIWWERR
jgi:hypothetical protein